MLNRFFKSRSTSSSERIDPIIRHLDKVLSSFKRKDLHEGFVSFLFLLFSHPDYTVTRTASELGKSERAIKYYRKRACNMGIIKEYKSYVSGFQRPMTELEYMPKPLKNEARKAILGYLKQRRSREEFLEYKRRTEENRARLREERKNKDNGDGSNSGVDTKLPLPNGKPSFKDSSTTNKRFIESEKVKNLRFSTTAIPWFAKKFNIDRKITEKIILSDFKQVEHEITTLGRQYKSPIAVLIARIKKSLHLAKAILAKGQTFFTREERACYKPEPVRKAVSEVERFKRIMEEERKRDELHRQMEQECTTDHDWSLIINNLRRAS